MGNNMENGMDRLFSGLAGKEPDKVTIPDDQQDNKAQSVTSSSGRKTRLKNERICTYIDHEMMNKVRTLSLTEGVSIKEIITYGLNVVLTRYEEQYGKIRVKKHNKGNIEKLLNK